jgi:hypothetical protein
MQAEWMAAIAMLTTIADFIDNSELNEQTIDGQTPAGDNIRVTIRHARADGPGDIGSYSVNAYVATQYGTYRMTLRLTAY